MPAPTVTTEALLADILRGWRGRLKLTQPEAAELLGVGVATYKRWELGQPCIFPKLVVSACKWVEHQQKIDALINVD